MNQQHVVCPRRLEHVLGAAEVHRPNHVLLVLLGVNDRGVVDDRVDAAAGCSDRCSVGDVDATVVHAFDGALGRQVEDDNLVTACLECTRDCGAHEAGASCYQTNGHELLHSAKDDVRQGRDRRIVAGEHAVMVPIVLRSKDTQGFEWEMRDVDASVVENIERGVRREERA